MEKHSQLFDKKMERVLYELNNQIFAYLDFSTLIGALTVSTEFYNLLNKYFKTFLVNNSLLDINEVQTSGDHYLRLFRAFYSREVLVSELPSEKISYDTLIMTRYPRCSTYGVKNFVLGVNFAVFHLYNNDMIFFKTQEYIDPSFDMKSVIRKNIRHDVSKFFTKARDLFYLSFTGQLHVIFYNSETPSFELNESLLEFTLNHPLKDCAFSFFHAVLFLKVPETEKSTNLVIKEEQKENDPKQIYQDIRFWSLENLVPEDLNATIRMKKIEGLDNYLIHDFCVGNPSAYFIANNNRVFQCSFGLLNNDKYFITPFEPLKNKMITKLWCGHNSFFALEQGEVESINRWSQNEILQWLLEKRFHSYRNIVKNNKITGELLLKANKQFLSDMLGMVQLFFYLFLS